MTLILQETNTAKKTLLSTLRTETLRLT